MKKLVYMLFSILLSSLSCITVWAEEDSEWVMNRDAKDRYFLEGYTGADSDVVIPETVQGYTIETLALNAFSDNTTITSLTFPSTVKKLKGNVAYKSENLSSIHLPEGLLVLGDGCFSYCGALKEVTIPSTVCYMGYGCFDMGYGLESVTFTGPCPYFNGDSFDDIPDTAVIYVPDDELEAYQKALGRMDDIDCEILPSGTNAVRPENSYEDNENLVFDAATGTVTGYTGSNFRLKIPESIDGVPVQAIGPKAFCEAYNVCWITLPEGLTEIQDEAFSFFPDYGILHAEFPSTLKSIGDRAFYASYYDRELSLPEGFETIGEEAFMGAKIRNLDLPEGTVEIGKGAFSGSYIYEAYLPSTIQSIGEDAFAMSNLNYLYMDSLVLPEIAPSAFQDTDLEDIDLNTKCTKDQMLEVQSIVDALGLSCRVWRNQNPDVSYPKDGLDTYENGYMTGYTGEMTHIRPYDGFEDGDIIGLADGALKGNTTVEYFSVPYNDVFTTIGAESFADSHIKTVDLFDSVTTIGEGAFRNCSYMEELTLPESVTSIGAGAFDGMTGLKKINVLCDFSLIPEGSFRDSTLLEEVTIAKGSIPANAFENLPLTSAVLGSEVQSVGEHAFAGTKIDTLVIPNNAEMAPTAVEGIPEIYVSADASDEYAEQLSETLGVPWYDPIVREGEPREFVKMPYAPSDEADFEFNKDTGMITAYIGSDVDVVVPGSIGGVTVTGIAYGAFDCARDYTDTEMESDQTEWLHLRTLVLPETITVIEDSFSYCQQLENFICYAPLETVMGNSFMLCRSLKNVVFVNGVRKLGDYCFTETDALETVYCGRHLDRIGAQAFFKSGISSLVVDARELAATAIYMCPNLKELHFTKRCQAAEMGAVNDCENLEKICFEGDDLSWIPADGLIGWTAPKVTVSYKPDLSEENLQFVQECMVWSDPAPEVSYVAEECGQEEIKIPDLAAILEGTSVSLAAETETAAAEN